MCQGLFIFNEFTPQEASLATPSVIAILRRLLSPPPSRFQGDVKQLQKMNKTARFVRAFQVDSSIVGWIAAGYLLLVLASSVFVGKNMFAQKLDNVEMVKEGPAGNINSPVRLQQGQ